MVEPMHNRVSIALRRRHRYLNRIILVANVRQVVRESTLMQHAATDPQRYRPPLFRAQRLLNNRERLFGHHRTSIPRTRASKALIFLTHPGVLSSAWSWSPRVREAVRP